MVREISSHNLLKLIRRQEQGPGKNILQALIASFGILFEQILDIRKFKAKKKDANQGKKKIIKVLNGFYFRLLLFSI
jgi:hypothetical protein